MTIHLLTIEHRHGADHWACATEAVALATVYGYVKEWWSLEHDAGAFADDTMPDDPNAAIAEYFSDIDDESYSIKELPVLEATADTLGTMGRL